MTATPVPADLPADVPEPVVTDAMVDDALAVEDAERDEIGLTHEQRERWRAHYHAIGVLVQLALAESPTAAEARRRLALLRLDLSTSEAAVTMIAEHWTPTVE